MAAKRRNVKLMPLEPVKPMKPTAGLPAAGPQHVPGFKAAPGRPATNVSNYLVKPTPNQRSGFELMNDEPSIVEKVDESLAKFQLPPALQPKYLRKPEVMETQRKKAISKGFVKPRGYQG